MDTKPVLYAPRYTDGSAVQVRDRVFIRSEQVHANVSALIQSIEHQQEWSVSEPGVMLEAEEFGLLFLSNSILKEQPLERA